MDGKAYLYQLPAMVMANGRRALSSLRWAAFAAPGVTEIKTVDARVKGIGAAGVDPCGLSW